MQYVWQHRLWLAPDMRTVDGRVVQVIDPGLLNTDAGPDFFNAKIRIDGRTWVGNVEIHVRASDWFRHHHDSDPAYDSVILHVVDRDDMPVRRRGSSSEIIPQLIMPCAPDFADRYAAMINHPASELACADRLAAIPSIYVNDWISALAYERVYEKSDRALSLLSRFTGDWEETCYVTLARALGFGINADAFERLALSLPLRALRKHSDSLPALEAILFGQAGLLDSLTDLSHPYLSRLVTDYRFYATKFGLQQPRSLGWKMSRMRPQNFPHRRIALLAAMLHGGFRLMSRLLTVTTPDEAASLFSAELSGFWHEHYTFSGTPVSAPASLSRASIHLLVINVVVPLLHAYGQATGSDAHVSRAFTLLQALAPERNSVIALFSRAGIPCPDAFTSQALLRLRRSYCETRKCLYCRLGHRILASHARRSSH